MLNNFKYNLTWLVILSLRKFSILLELKIMQEKYINVSSSCFKLLIRTCHQKEKRVILWYPCTIWTQTFCYWRLFNLAHPQIYEGCLKSIQPKRNKFFSGKNCKNMSINVWYSIQNNLILMKKETPNDLVTISSWQKCVFFNKLLINIPQQK